MLRFWEHEPADAVAAEKRPVLAADRVSQVCEAQVARCSVTAGLTCVIGGDWADSSVAHCDCASLYMVLQEVDCHGVRQKAVPRTRYESSSSRRKFLAYVHSRLRA